MPGSVVLCCVMFCFVLSEASEEQSVSHLTRVSASQKYPLMQQRHWEIAHLVYAMVKW